jgi:hypothetical protein
MFGAGVANGTAFSAAGAGAGVPTATGAVGGGVSGAAGAGVPGTELAGAVAGAVVCAETLAANTAKAPPIHKDFMFNSLILPAARRI